MFGLLIGGIVAATAGTGLAVAAGKARRRSVDARTQMSPPQLIALLHTQVKAVIREFEACRTAGAGETGCVKSERVQRLLKTASRTAKMIGGVPVFAAALLEMAKIGDDDGPMKKVQQSGEVWPGTTTPIVNYIENMDRA